MISYGPSKYWETNSRAGSETAIRPSRRPRTKLMYGLKAVYQGFEARKAWKVATLTADELSKTMYGRTGISGSWRWTMSNRSRRIRALTVA
jgi:hypothetical protein